MSYKRILITNDDGINSDGIARLADAARQFGEVWVVAPDSQRSGMSHSLSCHAPFEVWEVDFAVPDVHAYACSGTPVDCVRIGSLGLMQAKPDYVFTGINFGYNISWDIQYSATVAAALEAAFLGIPAIAFSKDNTGGWETVSAHLSGLMKEYINRPLGQDAIWNINFPGCLLNECKGVLRDCAVSQDDFYIESYKMSRTGDRIQCMLGSKRNWQAPEGTDLAAVTDNYIAVGVVHNLR